MVDVRKLAELARTHLLPTIWVAGPDLRGQRKLLRGRAYRVRLRTMRRGALLRCSHLTNGDGRTSMIVARFDILRSRSLMRCACCAGLLAALTACHTNPSAPTGPAAPLAVMVTPPTVASTRFQTISLVLTVSDSTGAIVPPDSVRWDSADSTKVSVSATGVIYTRAGTPGTDIRATAYRARSQGTGTCVVTIMSFPLQ